MKVLQVNPYLSRSSGGPFISVSRVSQELGRNGVNVAVIGVQNSSSPIDASFWQHISVNALPAEFPRLYSYSSKFTKQFSTFSPDIVHTHGIWLYPHLAAYRYCAEHNTPLIVSPRGMLEPWAFNHKAWKKRPLWWAYEKRSLQAARVIHATSNQEAEELRSLGLSNPIAIIPNGVDLPVDCRKLPSPTGEHVALFLSRIHRKKGLLNLIEAWKQVCPAGWHMIIAGPDEDGHEAELIRALQQVGLRDVFKFVGPTFDEQKSRLFRQAALFILPSYSENFGLAIAEALAFGVPVISTKGTPWPELEEFGCGWWVDIGVEPLAIALREAISLSDATRQAMGARGRILIEDRFSWPKVAQEMKSVYEWVLGDGLPPACVKTE
ncbi:MAG TPA: glycosyltransferase [Nitrospirota bacterium]|nr:glycosyltransferase [Nitrospirota bacterium]